MKRAGKTFSCPWLFIYPLFTKRTVPLGENSYKCMGTLKIVHVQEKYNMENIRPNSHHGTRTTQTI